MFSINDRVKQIRKHFGLSQAQFALRINRTSGLISLIATNRCNVSEETAKSICFVFSVNEEWLFTGQGEMTEIHPVDKENIRNRIQQIRKEKGLSMDKFGSEMGYTKQLISLIESGKANPTDEFMQKVSQTFGVNLEWIKTGKGEVYGDTKERVDKKLINWLNHHPEIIRELRRRSGLEKY